MLNWMFHFLYFHESLTAKALFVASGGPKVTCCDVLNFVQK